MPRKNDKKKVGVSISLEENTLQKLENFCKQNYNAQRSSVIERAIKEFLEREEK